jgi:hypothetical protein
MLALAGVGLGQGLFVSPNNNAMMGAAPAPLIGEAGGLINVVRACGTSIGIAAASACLSWRLEVLTGARGRTVNVAADAVAAAGGDVILLLAGFAAASGVISLVRAHRPRAPGEEQPPAEANAAGHPDFEGPDDPSAVRACRSWVAPRRFLTRHAGSSPPRVWIFRLGGLSPLSHPWPVLSKALRGPYDRRFQQRSQ